jgi:glycogen debranching enzyme
MKDNVTSLFAEQHDAAEPDYGIEAHASLTALPPKVLKHDDMFAVLDGDGDCGKSSSAVEGLYFRDTRYLSRWQLTIQRHRPLMLASTIHDDNSALTVTLTNPDIEAGSTRFGKDAIAITRTKFIWDGACFERIGLKNFDRIARAFTLEIYFDADFLDLFEVRGMERPARGTIRKSTRGPTVVFDYVGLDEVSRETTIEFDQPPSSLTSSRATFDCMLEPGERANLVATIKCREPTGDARPAPAHFLSAYRLKRRDARALTASMATVETSNGVFNDMVCRSTSDIYMLLSRTADGVYPHAGIPWYSTVFGRDGLITALLMLWVDPSIARGVLLYLAATQATEIDVSRDAQPGKILHEQRQCETARTGEVPFASYYGTVDATPLFVVLAGRYFARTRDEETIKRIWPNILAAIAWCDTYGDRDGDGFVEYFRETPNGLANQGWKDSFDSIFHRDGTLAEGPIALVEVQAYVYEARLQSAALAEHLGHETLATAWRLKAAALMETFNSAFWSEELGCYAIALDGDKRPCLVHSSNSGHVLMTDMASTERAHRVANVLLSPQLFCGWGVRTVAEDAARYNPMSYHNGSVWPHDNALIGLGLARSGHKGHLLKIFEGLYSAQSYQADRRLPELFCGFQRRRGRAPVSYPVSCSPQAWASATPFGLLGASLGLEIDCAGKAVQFNDPVLPGFLDDVTLRKLRVGTASIDVRLTRRDGKIALDVLKRDGDVDAIVCK